MIQNKILLFHINIRENPFFYLNIMIVMGIMCNIVFTFSWLF